MEAVNLPEWHSSSSCIALDRYLFNWLNGCNISMTNDKLSLTSDDEISSNELNIFNSIAPANESFIMRFNKFKLSGNFSKMLYIRLNMDIACGNRYFRCLSRISLIPRLSSFEDITHSPNTWFCSEVRRFRRWHMRELLCMCHSDLLLLSRYANKSFRSSS